MLQRRSTTRLQWLLRLAAATLLALYCVTSPWRSAAHASPGAASDQYLPPASANDAFSVRSPVVGEHMELTLRGHLDYLHAPVVYETQRGNAGSEQTALVSDQLRLWLGGALALWQRLLVFATLPVDLVMAGDALGELPTATGFGLGDLGLGVRGLLLDSGIFRLGAQLSATLPTGHGAGGTPAVAGDSGATLIPRLLGELRVGKVRVGLDLGLRLRRSVDLATVQLDDQLLFALAVRAPIIAELLDASAELFGSTLSADVGRRDTTALEALLGVGLHPIEHWAFGIAGAAGLLRGYGTPDWRILARATWNMQLGSSAVHAKQPALSEPAPASEPSPAAEVADTAATAVAAGPAASAQPGDLDADGHADETDACPAFAAAQSADGCPDDVRYDPDSGAVVLKPMPVFAPRTAQLDPASLDGLETLADSLRAEPTLRLMVCAHLSAAHRRPPRELGTQRARALGQWLSQRGVGPGQVELYDCGTSRPLRAPLDSERIELFLLSPLPKQGMPSSLGCTPLTLQP